MAEYVVDSKEKHLIDVVVNTVSGQLGLIENERIKDLLEDGNGLAFKVMKAKIQDGWK